MNGIQTIDVREILIKKEDDLEINIKEDDHKKKIKQSINKPKNRKYEQNN